MFCGLVRGAPGGLAASLAFPGLFLQFDFVRGRGWVREFGPVHFFRSTHCTRADRTAVAIETRLPRTARKRRRSPSSPVMTRAGTNAVTGNISSKAESTARGFLAGVAARVFFVFAMPPGMLALAITGKFSAHAARWY